MTFVGHDRYRTVSLAGFGYSTIVKLDNDVLSNFKTLNKLPLRPFRRSTRARYFAGVLFQWLQDAILVPNWLEHLYIAATGAHNH
jgi:hypothetical protein